MDILNFISWIKGKRVVTSVDSSQTLIPVGLKDPKRNDDYLAGAISVEDFSKQIRQYQSYTASINQTSDSDPTVAILFENSLEVNATFIREDVGVYTVQFDKPLFNTPFDYCTIQNPTSIDPDGSIIYTVEVKAVFFDTILINTFINGILSDNVMGGSNSYIPNTILDVRTYVNSTSFF